jgi:hypothetical protein
MFNKIMKNCSEESAFKRFRLLLWMMCLVSTTIPGIGNQPGRLIISEISNITIEALSPLKLKPKSNPENIIQYQWLRNGEPIAGANQREVNSIAVIPSLSGLWSVEMTLNSGGILEEEVANLTVLPQRFVDQEELTSDSDFNGDGSPDLLLAHEEGFLGIWTLNEETVTDSEFIKPGLQVGEWKVSGTGNMDGDRNTDILFRHPTGLIGIWYMKNPDEEISNAFSSSVQRAAFLDIGKLDLTDWEILGCADFNNDDQGELMMIHPDGFFALGFMKPENTETLNTVTLFPSLNIKELDIEISGVADFDLDHKAELLVTNSSGGLSIWNIDQLNGQIGFHPVSPGTYLSEKWQIVATADFDSNRSIDLVFRSKIHGNHVIWLMDGLNLIETRVLNPASPGPGWKVVGPGKGQLN